MGGFPDYFKKTIRIQLKIETYPRIRGGSRPCICFVIHTTILFTCKHELRKKTTTHILC